MIDYSPSARFEGEQKCLAHLESFLWSARTAVSAAKRLSHSPGTGGKYVRFRGQKVRRRVRDSRPIPVNQISRYKQLASIFRPLAPILYKAALHVSNTFNCVYRSEHGFRNRIHEK